MIATTSYLHTNNSAANFRAWAQWIHDQLTVFGLVQTADTGQINLTTVLAPAVSNTAMGYEIWRFDDTLQATKPVFIKIEYGSGSSSAADPSIWLTVGTGTNGAGTLTGQVSTRQQTHSASFTTANLNAYASGGTNRFVFAMGIGAASTSSFMTFGVERSHDATGADTNEAAVWHAHSNHGGNKTFNLHWLPFTGTVLATENASLAALPAAGTPVVVGGDVYAVPMKPFYIIERPPYRNMMFYQIGDFASEVTTNPDFYGAPRDYMPVGYALNWVGAVNPLARGTSCVGMIRYD